MNHEDLKQVFDDNGVEFEEQGEEILTHCPFCNSDKLKLSFNSDKNAVKCWICGESGPVNKGLEALGVVDFENYVAEGMDRGERFDVIRTYLGGRGFKSSDEYSDLGKLLDVVRMDYRDSQTLVSRKGKSFEYKKALSFKFQGLKEDGYTSSGFKYRSLESDPFLKFFHQDNEGAPKYYIPNLTRFKNSDSVVIVEGEIDALTLELFGINAIASTGVQKLDFVKDLYRFDKIYVILDNDADPKVKRQVELASKKMLSMIRNVHKDVSIYVAKLPAHIKDVNEAMNDYGFGAVEFGTIIAKAEEYLEGTILRSATSFMPKMHEFLNDDSKTKGLPTGFDGVDQALGGGERLGEIDALVARAKSGKNSYYHQLIWNRIANGTPVGYISRELRPASEVLPNLFSIEFGKNFWTLRDNEAPEEYARTMELADRKLAEWPLYFANGIGIFSITELGQFIQEAKKKGVNYFYFDHFHRAMLDSEDKKEIAKFIHDIKTLVSEENVHLNLIVQPTKLPNGQQEVHYSNMRGSVTIEQEVDQLWEFNRVAGEKNITKLRLAAARHRLANTGSEIYFQYDKETTRMIEVECNEVLEDSNIDSPTADYQIRDI